MAGEAWRCVAEGFVDIYGRVAFLVDGADEFVGQKTRGSRRGLSVGGRLAHARGLADARPRCSPRWRLQPVRPMDFRCKFAAEVRRKFAPESNPCAVYNLARLAATRAPWDSFRCHGWSLKLKGGSRVGRPTFDSGI